MTIDSLAAHPRDVVLYSRKGTELTALPDYRYHIQSHNTNEWLFSVAGRLLDNFFVVVEWSLLCQLNM